MATSPQAQGHYDRADSYGSLASSLRKCFRQTGELVPLEQAVTLEREALRLRPAGHPARTASCHNLALSLQMHYDQIGDATLLDEVLELRTEALRLTPEVHPDRAI
jgi:hypothetical protein